MFITTMPPTKRMIIVMGMTTAAMAHSPRSSCLCGHAPTFGRAISGRAHLRNFPRPGLPFGCWPSHTISPRDSVSAGRSGAHVGLSRERGQQLLAQLQELRLVVEDEDFVLRAQASGSVRFLFATSSDLGEHSQRISAR